MPGATSGEISLIEQQINRFPELGDVLVQEGDPLGLLSQIFQDSAFMLVDEKTLKFSCNCTGERVRRAMALLGVDGLLDILKEEGEAVVRCDFCAKEYRIAKKEIQELIRKSRPRGAGTR